MKSIAILIDYFGVWPAWFPVFLASCGHNSTVNWIIRTDCKIPENVPVNVKFIRMDFQSYIENVSRKLQLDFRPSGSYKICDIKPMLGDMYFDDIKEYDYYGFGDLDVIYGNIRHVYNDEVLSFDVISTHFGMISGHLALFRNIESLRKAYTRIPHWKDYIENPESTRFDEDIYSRLFAQPDSSGYKVYFREQFTTVFHPIPWHDGTANHPEVWFWKDGAVTNDRNIEYEYLYLHLMNFQSMRWTNDECRRRHIPWKDNPDVRFVLDGEEINGVRIDWNGIHALGKH